MLHTQTQTAATGEQWPVTNQGRGGKGRGEGKGGKTVVQCLVEGRVF